MRPSLSRKFTSAWIVLLACVAAIAATNLYASHVLDRQFRARGQLALSSADLLARLDRATALSHAAALSCVSSASTDEMASQEQQISQWESEVDALFVRLQDVLQDQQESDRLRSFSILWKEYARIRDEEFLPSSRTDKPLAAAMTRQDGKLGSAARSAFDALQDLRDAHLAASQRSLDLQAQSLWWRQVILFLGSLLAIVGFLVFGALLSARLGTGLRAVLQATQLMAVGDLDWSIGLKSGDELESIIGVLRRITRNMKKMLAARREADEQLQRAAQDLKEAKAALAAVDKRLAATLSLVDTAILTCDGAGRVTALNRAAESWTGWAQEAALGQSISQVCCIASVRTHERCQDLLQRAMQSGGILSLADPTVLVAPDGVERPVHVASTTLHDAEGHLTGAVFVLREDSKEHEE